MRTGFVASVILLGVVATAHAAEDDWQLLRKASIASHQQPLVGTYFHQTQGSMETFHLARSGNAELYEAVDGPPREIFRSGNEITFYAIDKTALQGAKISAMRLFPAVLPEDISNIQQSYLLKRLENDRVAQRDCIWLQLKPKDSSRYSLRMCVDPENGLPLKSMTVSPHNDVVEQNSFTELELGSPREHSLLKPRLVGKLSYQWRKPAGGNGAGDAAQAVSGLPSGFRLLRSARRAIPGHKGFQQHYMFSDGLAMLSLFVEPADGSKRPERVTTLYGPVTLASRDDGDHFLTLVGDLPEAGLSGLIKTIRLGK